MRISDWSSDVCSSDLDAARRSVRCRRCAAVRAGARSAAAYRRGHRRARRHDDGGRQEGRRADRAHRAEGARRRHSFDRRDTARSEEHTSELQSLMRISYAVFCLKKKKDLLYTNIDKLRNNKQTTAK